MKGLIRIYKALFKPRPLPSTLKSMQCRGLVYLLAIAQSFLFTKRPNCLRPLHTIKSVVFLLDIYTGFCGKRYIKSASCSQCCRRIA
jgi:hypothetical protein